MAGLPHFHGVHYFCDTCFSVFADQIIFCNFCGNYTSELGWSMKLQEEYKEKRKIYLRQEKLKRILQ